MHEGTGTRPHDRRPPAGRQDRHHRRLHRRLVLRLHAGDRDLRVDRLPERAALDVQRRGRSSVSGPTLPADIWHLYMDMAGAHFLAPTEFPQPKEPRRAREVLLPVHRPGRDRDRADGPAGDRGGRDRDGGPDGGEEAPVDPGDTDPAPPPPPPPTPPPPATRRRAAGHRLGDRRPALRRPVSRSLARVGQVGVRELGVRDPRVGERSR